MSQITSEEIEGILTEQLTSMPTMALARAETTKSVGRVGASWALTADLLALCVSAYLVTWPYLHSGVGIMKPLGFLVLYASLLILSGHACKVYAGGDVGFAPQEQLAVLRAAALSILLVAGCIYLSELKILSSLVVVETAVLSTLAMLGWRLLRRRGIIEGSNCRNVLIVNAGPVGQYIGQHLSQNRHLGLAVSGYLDRRQDGTSSHHPERRSSGNELKILGKVRDLARIIRSNFIDEILITTPEDRDLVKHLIFEARRSGIDASVIPDLYDRPTPMAPVRYLGHVPIISFRHQSVSTIGLLVKRCMDMLIAVTTLIGLSPGLLLVALLVKLSSRGPVLYYSTRVGKKGREFVCYKFRTMVANADELRHSLHHLNEREDILFKISNDPRVTRLGRFLRKYSIDELPQLLNILRGEMSLVGPRPGIPSEYKQYALEDLRRLDVVPGITGLWQVAARKDPSFQSYISLDTQYVNNWSVWLDCKILVRTISVVLAGTGQ